jgi:tRNA 2-selenouridine synthase
VEAFLAAAGPLIDLRSPAEFAQGHIPGATNLPLFDNDERAEIGTLYKQQGRQAAVLRGLALVGPRYLIMRYLNILPPLLQTVKQK